MLFEAFPIDQLTLLLHNDKNHLQISAWVMMHNLVSSGFPSLCPFEVDRNVTYISMSRSTQKMFASVDTVILILLIKAVVSSTNEGNFNIYGLKYYTIPIYFDILSVGELHADTIYLPDYLRDNSLCSVLMNLRWIIK